MFRVCRRRRRCVADWERDWNHRRPVKKRLEAAWCFCRKKREKSGVLLKESLLLAPGFMHQGDGVQAENAKESMSQRTKDGTISNVVASTESLNLRSSLSECEGSIFPAHSVRVTVRYCIFFDCLLSRSCARAEKKRSGWSHPATEETTGTEHCVGFLLICRVHRIFRALNVNT